MNLCQTTCLASQYVDIPTGPSRSLHRRPLIINGAIFETPFWHFRNFLLLHTWAIMRACVSVSVSVWFAPRQRRSSLTQPLCCRCSKRDNVWHPCPRPPHLSPSLFLAHSHMSLSPFRTQAHTHTCGSLP